MKKFNIQYNGGDTFTVETTSAREAARIARRTGRDLMKYNNHSSLYGYGTRKKKIFCIWFPHLNRGIVQSPQLQIAPKINNFVMAKLSQEKINSLRAELWLSIRLIVRAILKCQMLSMTTWSKLSGRTVLRMSSSRKVL
mgnify:CR=1 FL=1